MLNSEQLFYSFYLLCKEIRECNYTRAVGSKTIRASKRLPDATIVELEAEVVVSSYIDTKMTKKGVKDVETMEFEVVSADVNSEYSLDPDTLAKLSVELFEKWN